MVKIIEEKGGGAWKRQFNDKFRKEEDSMRKEEPKTTPSDASKGTAKQESPEECLLRNLLNRFAPKEAVVEV